MKKNFLAVWLCSLSVYASEYDIQQRDQTWVKLLAASQVGYVSSEQQPFGRVAKTVVDGASDATMCALITAVTKVKKKKQGRQTYLVYQSLLQKLSLDQQNMLINAVLDVDDYDCIQGDNAEREIVLAGLCADVSVAVIQQILSAQRTRYAQSISSNNLAILANLKKL